MAMAHEYVLLENGALGTSADVKNRFASGHNYGRFLPCN